MTFVTEGTMSSISMEWGTPQAMFDALDSEFHFTRDVCASHVNHKCVDYWTKDEDALSRTWEGVCFMNPPYGKMIGPFMRKARDSAVNDGCTVVCVIPARCDTAWWHDTVWDASEVRLVRGRLKYELPGSEASAPFPTAIVVFTPAGGPPRFVCADKETGLEVSATRDVQSTLADWGCA